jgi:capsular exopolysaccharide synthesis family protein
LKSRYEEAKLAEAGTTPDVSVLDVAVPPQRPRSSDGPRVIFLAIVAFVGLAVGLVLLLDRLDRRFRYPEQATKSLGLAIVGAVPRLRSRSRRPLDVETMTSLVEAFRTLRLSIRHEWAPGTPITLTVSSPGPNEGKSLVASNLAVSFANAGQRVLLVDGDARRGALNRTFGVARGPGLIDYLDGSHPIDEIIQSANMPNLSFIGSGSRPVNAPELLASERLLTLMSLLRERYDVVIVDAPPLLAGSDPLALGVATGNLLMVLRTAVSDWRLADAKLELVDRLPIRVLGTVLNGIEESGMYRYYGYEYAAKDGVRGSIAALAAPMGGVRA